MAATAAEPSAVCPMGVTAADPSAVCPMAVTAADPSAVCPMAVTAAASSAAHPMAVTAAASSAAHPMAGRAIDSSAAYQGRCAPKAALTVFGVALIGATEPGWATHAGGAVPTVWTANKTIRDAGVANRAVDFEEINDYRKSILRVILKNNCDGLDPKRRLNLAEANERKL